MTLPWFVAIQSFMVIEGEYANNYYVLFIYPR